MHNIAPTPAGAPTTNTGAFHDENPESRKKFARRRIGHITQIQKAAPPPTHRTKTPVRTPNCPYGEGRPGFLLIPPSHSVKAFTSTSLCDLLHFSPNAPGPAVSGSKVGPRW
jgi:hypothetical protein